MNTLLLTGTDTDAGKTVVTCALAAYWRHYYPSRSLGIMKPIQTGVGDRELYTRLFALDQSWEEMTPLHYQAPLAPPLAAAQEGRRVELAAVWSTFAALQQRQDFLLVEALGGLGSPITPELTVADLAKDWRLPTVLVVPVKLGAIGQAVANVALGRYTGVHLKGIILNCLQPGSVEKIGDWASMELITSLTQLPILGTMPHLDDPTNLEQLVKVASDWDLEALMPL